MKENEHAGDTSRLRRPAFTGRATQSSPERASYRPAQSVDRPPVMHGAGHAVEASNAAPRANGRPSPITIESAMDVRDLGEIFHQSGLFQDIRSAAQAIVKVLKGRELGIPPLEAMTTINIIRGKVALSAQAMAALIKRSQRYRFLVRRHDEGACHIEFFERANGAWEPMGISQFTIEDARRADVAGGENWRRYPRNMLYARALSNGARWYCPDVVSGVYTPDELGMEEDEDGQPTGHGWLLHETTPPSSTSIHSQDDTSVNRMQAGTELVTEAAAAEPAENAAEASVDPAESPASRTVRATPERQQHLVHAVLALKPHCTSEELELLRHRWKDPEIGDEQLHEMLRMVAEGKGVEIPSHPEAVTATQHHTHTQSRNGGHHG